MRRSGGDLAAIQFGCLLSKIFRPAGSRIVFAMVPQMGSTNSPRAEVEWLFFPERWRRAVEPDAAPRNPHDAARFVRVTKHHSLDQIDCDPEWRGRAAVARPFQTNQFAALP